jgi:hypothetical protein
MNLEFFRQQQARRQEPKAIPPDSTQFRRASA